MSGFKVGIRKKPKLKTKPHHEKNDTPLGLLVIPENATSKRAKILWLLENLGKNWRRISCAKVLEKLRIKDTPNNRKQFYNYKSEYKHSHEKSYRGLKPPKISYHNFNQSSLFLTSVFSGRVRSRAVEMGWEETSAKNGMLLWKEKRGWLKWFPSTGKVQMHVKKPVNDGKILQLLSNGFFNTNLIRNIENLVAFFRSFYLKDVKLTAHLGKDSRIPPFRLEIDNGFNKLIVMNDRSHPHSIELQYYLLKDAENFRAYLKDSHQIMDYTTKTNLEIMEVLKSLKNPNFSKPNRLDSSGMVV